MTTEDLAAELAEHLAETFPHLDVAAILRQGAEALDGEDEMAELGEFLQTTADQIPTERTPTMPETPRPRPTAGPDAPMSDDLAQRDAPTAPEATQTITAPRHGPDLTKRIAEALDARIKQATVPDTSVPSFGGSVGHLFAATPYDLAITAMEIVGPELAKRDALKAAVEQVRVLGNELERVGSPLVADIARRFLTALDHPTDTAKET